MTTHYAKRALDIFREEGPIELSKASKRFILHRLDPQYYRRFKLHTWKNHLQNHIRYDAPPDPYKIIEIQPSEIEYRISWLNNNRPLEKIKYRGIARTKAGNWDNDENKEKIEDIYQIAGLIERFEQGLKWEDTTYYQTIYTKHKNNEKYKDRGFGTLEEYLQAHLESYEELYESIKSNGYKQNHKGGNRQPGKTQPVRDGLEVLITIDRDGKIHFFEGHHRFAIARILDIEIPAHVACRHKRWQELRDEIHNNGLPEDREDLRDHPDLQDILD